MRSYTTKEKLAVAIVLVIVASTLWMMESSYSVTGLFKTTDAFQTNISSDHGVLMKLGDKEAVIYEKNAEETIYPASLTKIMTVLIAIEQANDLNERAVVNGDIHRQLTGENASMAGFVANEEVALIDLMYGAMLPSGAEASLTLATHIAGTEANYVERMNEKSVQLGLEQTHFTNTTGLHNEDHYTSSHDLIVLLQYALENETFRQIFTSISHLTQPTSHHSNGLMLTSSLFSRVTEPTFSGGLLLGGKTGYTTEAGLCLASIAEVNGQEYILVTAQAQGNHHTEPFHIEDALYVYGNLIP